MRRHPDLPAIHRTRRRGPLRGAATHSVDRRACSSGTTAVRCGPRTGCCGVSCDATFDEVDAPDVVVFPGGIGTRQLIHDEAIRAWLQAVHPNTTFTTSVCTGALLLAAAGLLDGLTATTHWRAADLLNGLGARYVPDESSSTCRSGSSPPPGCPAASTWPCGWSSCSSIARPPGGSAAHRIRPAAALRLGRTCQGRSRDGGQGRRILDRPAVARSFLGPDFSGQPAIR